MLKIAAGFFLGLLWAGTINAADLVLKNGKFYTLDSSRPWAEAVAIESGRVVYVGDAGGVHDFIGTDTVQYDLMGKFVLPGWLTVIRIQASSLNR